MITLVKHLAAIGLDYRRLSCSRILIVTAWTQRRTAKRISKEAEKAFGAQSGVAVIQSISCNASAIFAFGEWQNDVENPKSARQHKWKLTHSFSAIMGGIAIDPCGGDEYIPGLQCPMLTADGISFLLENEPQLLPDISGDDVKDKSKGGSSAKFLACDRRFGSAYHASGEYLNACL